MSTHSQPQKVRVVIDCSLEERARIKMLAARKQMTISQYFLFLAKEESSKGKVPNQKTIEAHQEALEGGGTFYETMDDFWTDMGIDRNAEP